MNPRASTISKITAALIDAAARLERDTSVLGAAARVTLLVIGSTGALHAGPVTFLTALPVGQGQAVFRGQFVLVRASDDPTLLARQLKVGAAPFALAAGLTPRLAIFVAVPFFFEKSLELETAAGRRTRRTSGFGDALVFARYTVLAVDEPGATLRLAPFAGVELPTGADQDADALGVLPPPLQLGSGSWDGLVGLVLTRQTQKWQLDADLAYRRNGESNQFRFGDQLGADLSLQYRVWPEELGEGVPSFLYAVVETNLVREGKSEVAGIPDPDSGGTRWDVDLGLQYVRTNVILEAALQLPLRERGNGRGLESDYRLTAGVRWNFSLPFQR